MAYTAPSTMDAGGGKAPDFELLEPLSGERRSLAELKGDQATLVIFICNHCPFVLRTLDGMIELAADYAARSVRVIGINSNDIRRSPDDGPEQMVQLARERSLNFAYLYDADQRVARAYDAVCTPDLFLFDGELQCRYRGQLDDARPGNDAPNDAADARRAIDAVLAGREVPGPHYPSSGCSIKWAEA